jgi:hypothetical protein
LLLLQFVSCCWAWIMREKPPFSNK